MIDPTGKSFEARIVDVFRFKDDQIASQHEYFDRLRRLTELGWIETTFISSRPTGESDGATE